MSEKEVYTCIMCKNFFENPSKMFVLEDKKNNKFYLQCEKCAKISDGRKIIIIQK